MKKNLVLMAALAAGVAFTACQNDDEVNSNDNQLPVALNLESVGLKTTVDSRAGITADAFTSGESLGLYIYNGTFGTAYNTGAGTNLPSTENVPYTQSESGWDATSPIILSSTFGTVWAYYPYDKTYNGTGADVPVTVAANQDSGQSDGVKDAVDNDGNIIQYDYMYSNKEEKVSNKDAKIDITMNHALAMVSFKFVQDDEVKYPGEGIVNSIVLKNATGFSVLKTGKGTMNIETGEAVPTGTAAGTITLTPDKETLLGVTDVTKYPRMLVYPVESIPTTNLELDVTVDGNLYNVVITDVMLSSFVKGNNYQFTLELKGTELEVKNVSIVKWELKEIEGNELQAPVQ